MDTNTTYTLDQNTMFRSIATTYHRAYVDCMTPAVSYEWLVAQGYMSDTRHQNYAGSLYLGGIAWNDLGFFAIRAPRTVFAQSLPDQVNLQYATAAGFTYTLEASPDFLQWQDLLTTPGTGATMSTNVSRTDPRCFFRLRLDP